MGTGAVTAAAPDIVDRLFQWTELGNLFVFIFICFRKFVFKDKKYIMIFLTERFYLTLMVLYPYQKFHFLTAPACLTPHTQS